jgi:carbonic anhydrase
LEWLLEGNRKFVAGRRAYPNQTPAHRQELVAGQRPFAAILGCSDSRVPPEMIFDQGLGDLFTIRVAGNVLDNAILGTLEYAVQHLGLPLVLVLGHSSCGAVQATLAGNDIQGRVATLVAAIQPAIELAKMGTGEVLDQAVRIHVARAVHQLRIAPPILALFREGKLEILGAYYDLASGVVEVLS